MPVHDYRASPFNLERDGINISLGHARSHLKSIDELNQFPWKNRYCKSSFVPGLKPSHSMGILGEPSEDVNIALSCISNSLHCELRTFLKTFATRLEAREAALHAACSRLVTSNEYELSGMARRLDNKLSDSIRDANEKLDRSLDGLRKNVEDVRSNFFEFKSQRECSNFKDRDRQFRDLEQSLESMLSHRLDMLARKTEDQRQADSSQLASWRHTLIDRCDSLERSVARLQNKASRMQTSHPTSPDTDLVKELSSSLPTKFAQLETFDLRIKKLEAATRAFSAGRLPVDPVFGSGVNVDTLQGIVAELKQRLDEAQNLWHSSKLHLQSDIETQKEKLHLLEENLRTFASCIYLAPKVQQAKSDLESREFGVQSVIADELKQDDGTQLPSCLASMKESLWTSLEINPLIPKAPASWDPLAPVNNEETNSIQILTEGVQASVNSEPSQANLAISSASTAVVESEGGKTLLTPDQLTRAGHKETDVLNLGEPQAQMSNDPFEEQKINDKTLHSVLLSPQTVSSSFEALPHASFLTAESDNEARTSVKAPSYNSESDQSRVSQLNSPRSPQTPPELQALSDEPLFKPSPSHGLDSPSGEATVGLESPPMKESDYEEDVEAMLAVSMGKRSISPAQSRLAIGPVKRKPNRPLAKPLPGKTGRLSKLLGINSDSD